MSATLRMKYAVAATGILLLIFLTIDLLIPLGVAAGVPYLAVVLTAWWMADQRAVFVLAGLSTLFVIIGYFFSPDAGILWQVLANRAMAIFAIWTTATLLLMATRSTERQGKFVQRRTRELRKSEKILRLITDNIPALISYIDNEYRYRFLNKRYEEWFCRPIKEMIDRRCRLSSVRCRTRSLHHAQRVGHWNRYPN